MGGKGHFKEGTQGKIVGRNAESDGVMVEYVDENGNKSSTCVGARHIPEDKRESALAAADKAKHAKEEQAIPEAPPAGTSVKTQSKAISEKPKANSKYFRIPCQCVNKECKECRGKGCGYKLTPHKTRNGITICTKCTNEVVAVAEASPEEQVPAEEAPKSEQ